MSLARRHGATNLEWWRRPVHRQGSWGGGGAGGGGRLPVGGGWIGGRAAAASCWSVGGRRRAANGLAGTRLAVGTWRLTRPHGPAPHPHNFAPRRGQRGAAARATSIAHHRHLVAGRGSADRPPMAGRARHVGERSARKESLAPLLGGNISSASLPPQSLCGHVSSRNTRPTSSQMRKTPSALRSNTSLGQDNREHSAEPAATKEPANHVEIPHDRMKKRRVQRPRS